MINHWNNATPLQPHTHAMKDKAKELWAEAKREIDHIWDENNSDAPDTDTLQHIEDIQDIAADLERFAFWPVEFALPPGECNHVLPEQSCIFCQPRADQTAEIADFTNSAPTVLGVLKFCQPKDDDYDFTDPTQNPYILSGEELKRVEELI